MPRFSVRGAEIAWEFSDEFGRPVVQLHGLTSSRARDRVLDLDLGRGLSGTRLLRYDARGHGQSSGGTEPEEYRWPALAEDLLHLLEHWFPGEQVHGVGPSMGTATLLHAAVQAPGRFSGLTLLLPPTAWHTRVAQAQDYRRIAAFIEAHGAERFIAASRSMPRPPATVGTPETTPDVDERLLPAIYRGAALSDLPDPEQIAGIEVPTTVLAWVDDPAHPLSTAEALVDLLPHATLDIAQSPADVDRWPEALCADVERPLGAHSSR
ncbi:alpha/beta fold hydrolase [Citricoccus sp. GCM10030269]|uniref:alpha/beta fold hydrolase n=1 Tax=Citricoccus sp. GCM10030269 TaxID=3273388 RepID=UPI00360A6151